MTPRTQRTGIQYSILSRMTRMHIDSYIRWEEVCQEKVIRDRMHSGWQESMTCRADISCERNRLASRREIDIIVSKNRHNIWFFRKYLYTSDISKETKILVYCGGYWDLFMNTFIHKPSEEEIEGNICEFLMYKWAKVDKIISEWRYNPKKGIYQRRKSAFANPGISDIIGCIEGRYFAIEVKKPSEMNFFDRSLHDLTEAFIEAQRRWLASPTLKKYSHAIDQRKFLDDVIRANGVWFFASSIEEVVINFQKFGILIKQ